MNGLTSFLLSLFTSSEITVKGTVFTTNEGKEDPFELDSILVMLNDAKDVV